MPLFEYFRHFNNCCNCKLAEVYNENNSNVILLQKQCVCLRGLRETKVERDGVRPWRNAVRDMTDSVFATRIAAKDLEKLSTVNGSGRTVPPTRWSCRGVIDVVDFYSSLRCFGVWVTSGRSGSRTSRKSIERILMSIKTYWNVWKTMNEYWVIFGITRKVNLTVFECLRVRAIIDVPPPRRVYPHHLQRANDFYCGFSKFSSATESPLTCLENTLNINFNIDYYRIWNNYPEIWQVDVFSKVALIIMFIFVLLIKIVICQSWWTHGSLIHDGDDWNCFDIDDLL